MSQDPNNPSDKDQLNGKPTNQPSKANPTHTTHTSITSIYRAGADRLAAERASHDQNLPQDPSVNPTEDDIAQASLTEAQSIPLQGPSAADIAAEELAQRISDADRGELMTKPLELLNDWEHYFEAVQLARRTGRDREQAIAQLKLQKTELAERDVRTPAPVNVQEQRN